MELSPCTPETESATILFAEKQLLLAREMKSLGLPWEPSVGCYVWDEKNTIKANAPFPNDVYFILNLSRFLDIFETPKKMKEDLVWIPTWHQARLLCRRCGIPDTEVARLWQGVAVKEPGDEIRALYQLLIKAMKG